VTGHNQYNQTCEHNSFTVSKNYHFSKKEFCCQVPFWQTLKQATAASSVLLANMFSSQWCDITTAVHTSLNGVWVNKYTCLYYVMSSTASSGKCIGYLDAILSCQSVHNKLTLYKQVVCPVWSYGVQLWDCASDSNIQEIQRYQNKVLKYF
jgi:hypothetical protein